MAVDTDAADSRAVLVVDADPKEVANLRQDMPDWRWIQAPEGWPFSKESDAVDGVFQAILIFARPKKEDRALSVCKHICEENTMERVPLLVAISQYQMELGNEIKCLPRGSFIFTPIEEKALLDRIEAAQKQ